MKLIVLIIAIALSVFLLFHEITMPFVKVDALTNKILDIFKVKKDTLFRSILYLLINCAITIAQFVVLILLLNRCFSFLNG